MGAHSRTRSNSGWLLSSSRKILINSVCRPCPLRTMPTSKRRVGSALAGKCGRREQPVGGVELAPFEELLDDDELLLGRQAAATRAPPRSIDSVAAPVVRGGCRGWAASAPRPEEEDADRPEKHEGPGARGRAAARARRDGGETPPRNALHSLNAHSTYSTQLTRRNATQLDATRSGRAYAARPRKRIRRRLRFDGADVAADEKTFSPVPGPVAPGGVSPAMRTAPAVSPALQFRRNRRSGHPRLSRPQQHRSIRGLRELGRRPE